MSTLLGYKPMPKWEVEPLSYGVNNG